MMTKVNFINSVSLFCAFLITMPLSAQHEQTGKAIVKQDVLIPAIYNSLSIKGVVGQQIDSCIVNGVMAKNYELYSIPFRDKLDNGGGFTGEFWGKWFTYATLSYGYKPDKSHKSILDKSVLSLLQTQEADGRISSYSRDQDFGYWDIWGRKYVLLGLIADYDATGNNAALQAACRATDALIEIAGPGKRN